MSAGKTGEFLYERKQICRGEQELPGILYKKVTIQVNLKQISSGQIILEQVNAGSI